MRETKQGGVTTTFNTMELKEKYKPLSDGKILRLLSRIQHSRGIFLETAQYDRENNRSFLFSCPDKIIEYHKGQDVDIFFKEVEYYHNEGFWIAGYLTYEFGYVFEPVLKKLLEEKTISFPLAWFGVFENVHIVRHADTARLNSSLRAHHNHVPVHKGKFSASRKEYNNAICRIKKYLARGDTYQVNYTHKYRFNFSGDVVPLYLYLRKNQPTSYTSFIHDGKRKILSFSPELFFRIQNRHIITRPMKGTYPRGRGLEEDMLNRGIFQCDEKNRAENTMIVDLLRNDMGKISCEGTVRVTRPFDIETYPSLFQMTSTIQAKLKAHISIKNIFEALFPSGSVTGAPKISTMKIIHRLEEEPRDIYTGAIGFISPQKEMCFNVAIRTLVVQENKAEFGVGGGIVADSKAFQEYQECVLKTSFLFQEKKNFSLIETILWHDEHFTFLDLHMQRLKKSCVFFNMPLSTTKLKEKLFSISRQFKKGKKYTMRVLLNQRGEFNVFYSPLNKIGKEVQIKLSSKKVDSKNIFLFHKTTVRDLYEHERKRALQKGFFDVVFTNERNELTEGAISNIFLEINGMLTTPKLSSGLLPGVLRQHLIQKGQAVEKVLYPSDIKKAEKIFIGNSVRGLIPATMSAVKNLSNVEV